MASGSNSFLGGIRSRLPRKRPHSSPDPPDPSTNNNPGGGGGANSRSNDAVLALKWALEILQGGLQVFSPLKSAMDELVECTAHLQIADHHSYEYAQLAADLANLAYSLQARLSQSNPTHTPFSVQNVARAIKELAQHIQLQRDRSRRRRFAAAKEDEDDILGCYRRVAALFEQLQVDISLCIWDVVREQQMNAYLQHLSPAYDAYYNSALPAATTKRRACTKNTRTKVLADARDWTRDEKAAKIYWMNGMAGTGKTTIACSLCKTLEDDKQLGASFFCSRDSPTCRDVNKLVPTIAYQLGRYSNPYRQVLCDVLSNNPDVAKKDLETQFDNLIAKPLAGVKEAMPKDVVVVIDALDECADVSGTKQVLNLLFRHATELPIKFFVTSRPEPGIAAKMTQQDSSSRSILRLHDIEQSLVQADIRTYLTEALAPIQPSTEHIEQLTARAGRLFIFAATVVRYISPDDESVNHNRRLLTMLETTPKRGDRTHRGIDELYSMIVLKVLEGGQSREDEAHDRRLVLWTVVCAREPMTISTLAEVLDFENEREVELAIKPLASVLHVSENTRVVSTLHASFPDFLLSEERAGLSLYCSEAKHHEYLATCCFKLMKHSLRFNICQLETSNRFDKDVPNFQTRVNQAISIGLFYVCRYWGDHLFRAATSNLLPALLDEFLQHRLLFWMEVLNLKGWIGKSNEVLFRALTWLQTDDGSSELRQFTHDARNFVTAFAANPTSLSTPHIYLSVLPFTSNQSHVRMTYWPRTRGLLRVDGTGMEARGSAALATWNVGSEVINIAQSSDGKRIVSGSSDGTVSIWDVTSGARIVGPLQTGESAGWNWPSYPALCYGPHVAFSLDDKHIACRSRDYTIRVWDAHTGSLITGPLNGHAGPILSVASSPVEPLFASYSRDGLRIVSASDDNTVRVWDAQVGTALAGPFEGHTNLVLSVAFSPGSTQVVSGSRDGTIRMWDSQNGSLIAGPLEGHRNWVNSVLFSPDGTRIISGSSDGTICVWDARLGTAAVAESSGHTAEIYSVAFSPDGMRAVSGSRDCTIRVWDTHDGRLVVGPLEGHTDSVYSVAFSPDGARIVSGSKDRTLHTWDALTGTLIGSFEGHTDQVNSVAFSPDGSGITSGSRDRTIRVWDSQTGELVVDPLKGHTNLVMSVAFSPDGTRIVSGSWDQTVRMWNVLEGTAPIWTSNAHSYSVYCVAFSSDGTRVASGSNDNTILVLNAFDGTLLHGPFKGHTSSVWSVAFSPDGTRIVSGSQDRTICVWDAQNGTVVSGPFQGHTSDVRSVAFSPHGRRIVSGSGDCAIRFWEVPAADSTHPSYFGQCTLRNDGWVTHSDSQLLVWLPPDLRAGFPLPPYSGIISESTILADYSNLLVGNHWHECYLQPPATTPP